MLERLFKLSAHGTTVKTEMMAGLTTFLTMAYIIFVNPSILADAGMDKGAVFVATCLAAAIGCFIMGFIANYPIALAPGMGLNAFFTYGVVLGMGHSWQTALGAVFLSGVIFLLLSLFKVREWIINAIPKTLKLGIATGIGSFLALIALKNAGIIVAHPATFVALGDITSFVPLMSIIGFFLIAAFTARKIPGAVMIAILAMTVVGVIFGDVTYAGIVSAPPSLAPTFMQMDIASAAEIGMLSVVFAFLFVDLFDTSGTLIAVTQRAGLTDDKGNIERLGKALSSDSIATLSGAALGTSTTTSYIESAAGVAEGGRTGLTAVVVGVLFVLSIFFAPLAGMIPVYATTGAIFYVAILMLFNLKDIDWGDITEAAPVTVILLFTPLTFSIAHGITLAFITYTFTKALCGKANEVSKSVWFLTALFVAKIAFVG
ncbi:MAG: AGZA family xanthine/uracil permease-like MFS transporter [Psychrosphaera sp.]|jgi:AGZA family xanthine/uracil permease-like MFS transporter|uniref:NCS2 family permease n=1 Tax=Psychrosphaera aquimarina TaxID=2044854 RepID=A0ABU3R3C6_9GAMM|nr:MULTISPECIES: NCS2 family permease [Psychrosphaera]MBU2919114.1 NCS2 family permease [Psychrosphaera sp. F3M07]MDU0114029.1 NCS2 family permease [Psychrosphaera aquimarina]